MLLQVVAGLFSADTDMGTVNGPLALLVADKWVERATAFHKFWINVLLWMVGPARAGGDRLSRLEAAEPDRRHGRPAASRSMTWWRRARPRRRSSSRSGRLAMSLLLAAAAIVYFIVRAGG